MIADHGLQDGRVAFFWNAGNGNIQNKPGRNVRMVGLKFKRDEARYRRGGELSEADPTVSVAVKDVHREVPSNGYRPCSSTDDPLKDWDFSRQHQ